ncbi:hypothetical protein [Streptomyces sp. NPDC013740]|uniref:hypothetical protein n=1 Tax=Streptomyces sp. NPDC013740 TaxID=3364867 RepID=UPI0036F86F6C
MTNKEWLIAEAPSVTDWIQAVSSVVAALGTVAAFMALWISIQAQRAASDQARRLRLVPPPELQSLLLRLDERFSDIIAGGGKPAAWFITEEQRRDSQMMAAHAGQINDDTLSELVGLARAEYDTCFATGVSDPNSDPRLVDEQLAAARRGQFQARSAIERSNSLLRESRP